MMEKEVTTTLCRFSDDVVAYLYDELAAGDRDVFEAHLPGCTACTDEFAAVADTRFSVYEWHKEAFVPLATPYFSRPYESPARVGILAQLAGSFAAARPSLAFAGGFAVLAVAAFVGWSMFGTSNDQIAANVEVPEVRSPVRPIATTTTGPPSIDVPEAIPVPVRARAVRPNKTRPTVAARRSPTPTVEPVVPEQLRQAKRAPALSYDIEAEDESLRLTDLFEEVGG